MQNVTPLYYINALDFTSMLVSIIMLSYIVHAQKPDRHLIVEQPGKSKLLITVCRIEVSYYPSNQSNGKTGKKISLTYCTSHIRQ